jgi:LDH2 family malate/lactate/ureidoglycolate dehydrogenase
MTSSSERISQRELVAWSDAMLQTAGLDPTDAQLIACYLAEADERGHPSHGTDQLPSYVRGFLGGELNVHPDVQVVRQTGAMAVVDGDNGLGHVVADYSMELAIKMANDYGIGLVTARNSNHFGMAGHWPLKAVRAGMIGFTTTNGPPVMTPWGGRQGAICNNPFAWGIPAGEEPPILLDMALTSGARGKVRLANQRGEAIPAGWALDRDGQPTTDAQAALDGVMLPLAEHKGSGIAIVNEVLASAMSASLFLTQITSVTMASTGVHTSWKIGHTFIAIDPGSVRPIDEFRSHVDQIIRELRSTPPSALSDGVQVPGERAARRAEEAARLGIPIAAQSIAKLSDFGREHGVPFPVELLQAEVST